MRLENPGLYCSCVMRACATPSLTRIQIKLHEGAEERASQDFTPERVLYLCLVLELGMDMCDPVIIFGGYLRF